jgi:hypothetical protein
MQDPASYNLDQVLAQLKKMSNRNDANEKGADRAPFSLKLRIDQDQRVFGQQCSLLHELETNGENK